MRFWNIFKELWVVLRDLFSAASADRVEVVSPVEHKAIIKAIETTINLCFICRPSRSSGLRHTTFLTYFFNDILY